VNRISTLLKHIDINKMINSGDYFYCLRAKCTLRLVVCIKRQALNKGNFADEQPSYLCNACSRIRENCRLHLPVCLKSPKSSKDNNDHNRTFLICKNCRQGKENAIKWMERDNNQKIENLVKMAHSIVKIKNEGKDKGINEKSLIWPNEGGNIYSLTACNARLG